MNLEDRWKKVGEIGAGGQGVVHKVLNLKKVKFDDLPRTLNQSIQRLSTETLTDEARLHIFQVLRSALLQMIHIDSPDYSGAAKVLHKPADARDAGNAAVRLRTEIEVLRKVSHPNLIQILDSDPDFAWFVAKFYPGGTLAKIRSTFRGNALKTLRSIRPLVEGVAALHAQPAVHRDIKPDNIFIDADGSWILGDFGIVYFEDAGRTRISNTFQNVGSRDWEPAWAQGVRIDDVTPTFDVYSLGKVIWSMIADQPILQLWYFDRKGNSLEDRFPDQPEMKLVNALLAKCIVEDESDCLPNATDMLTEIDNLIRKLESSSVVLDPRKPWTCSICGEGTQRLIVDRSISDMRNFGFQPAGNRALRIASCNSCGHLQFFLIEDNEIPPAWIS